MRVSERGTAARAAAGFRFSGRPGGPTPLRCSPHRAGAELASLTAFAALRQAAPSQLLKRAARAPGAAALLSASHSPGRCPGRSARYAECWHELMTCHHSALAAARPAAGRFLRGREHSEAGRRAQRASTSDWARLFERSERSERSEFCAPGTRSEHRGKPARRDGPRSMSPAAGRAAASRRSRHACKSATNRTKALSRSSASSPHPPCPASRRSRGCARTHPPSPRRATGSHRLRRPWGR